MNNAAPHGITLAELPQMVTGILSNDQQATTTLPHNSTTMSQFTTTATDHGSTGGSTLTEHVQHQPFENSHDEFPNDSSNSKSHKRVREAQPQEQGDKDEDGEREKEPPCKNYKTSPVTIDLISGIDHCKTSLKVSALETSQLLRDLDISTETAVILPTAPTPTILVIVQWMQMHSDAQQGTDENMNWLEPLKTNPTLFASVLATADFLAIDILRDNLLSSFDSCQNLEIITIKACYQNVPNIVSMVRQRLDFATNKDADHFLLKLTTDSNNLSWTELELCDGKYLNFKNCANYHLGLYQWSEKQRVKRSNIFDFPNVLTATVGPLSDVHVAVLMHEQGTPVENSEQVPTAASTTSASSVPVENIEQVLWDAVEANNLSAAKDAYLAGSRANLDYNKDFGIKPYDGAECPGIHAPHGMTTLMLAAHKDDSIEMMRWLMNMPDVNINHVEDVRAFVIEGGIGMNALILANTCEKVEMLLSCGADANSMWVPCHYEEHLDKRSVLAHHVTDGVGDGVVPSLLRHGADVNFACFPLSDWEQGQQNGSFYEASNPPFCHWPNVVDSGNVKLASELLEKFGADVNWPKNCYQEYGLGETVLINAIQAQNMDMIQLLLDHGADVNLSEQLHNIGQKISDCRMFDPENESGYEYPYFLSEVQALHYFAVDLAVVADDDDEWDCAVDEVTFEGEHAKKLATPLSVAIATGNDNIVQLLKARGAAAQPENSKLPIKIW